MAAAPTIEPHTMLMETKPSQRERSALYSMEFEFQMVQWMDNLDTQLHTMQSDIHNLTQDIAQFYLNSEQMRFQLDHQSQLLQDIWTVFHQQPLPPPC